jgi:hypothetical protein
MFVLPGMGGLFLKMTIKMHIAMHTSPPILIRRILEILTFKACGGDMCPFLYLFV